MLDEMLSPVVARELTARGHDVEAVSGHPEWSRLPDAALIEIARNEGRVIVTANVRHFRPLHEAAIQSGEGHVGVIFLASAFGTRRADFGRLIAGLEVKLSEFPGVADLANGETWLHPVNSRARR